MALSAITGSVEGIDVLLLLVGECISCAIDRGPFQEADSRLERRHHDSFAIADAKLASSYNYAPSVL